MHFVLHIGPDKTGTSAVQDWFLNQSDELAEAGILYSVNGCGEDGAFNALAAALMGQPSSGDPQDGVRKLALFNQDLATFKGDTVLLSAEDFSYRMLKKDNGISIRFGPKRVAEHASAIVEALKSLGATRITALICLRREGDRAVSRVVQTIPDLRLPQITPSDLPPDLDRLVHSHHFCTKALTDLGVEILPVLYADPEDIRPLAARLLCAAGLGRALPDAPLKDRRVNPSMGLSGCLAAMQIKDVILKNRVHRPQRIKAGLRRGNICMQRVYQRLGGHEMDTSFNGVGPTRVDELIIKQRHINGVFGKMLPPSALEGLNQSKWQDAPLSPMQANALDAQAKAHTADLLDGFEQDIRDISNAQAVYGLRCLDTFDEMSHAFKAETVW